jgi:hypothetical protein
MAGGGMSRLARSPRSLIDGQMNAAQGSSAGAGSNAVLDHPGLPLAAVGVGTVVRPGRVRNRTKTEQEDKLKKPADGVRKKSPPARKAPARGRYVDEYARPAC